MRLIGPPDGLADPVQRGVIGCDNTGSPRKLNAASSRLRILNTLRIEFATMDETAGNLSPYTPVHPSLTLDDYRYLKTGWGLHHYGHRLRSRL
jgi:hypothetical protein